ncbi:hypothetical protein BDP27DRAFT_1401316 [Rhodocollybia butyracea]|uniref:Uncharacterized protein n=1 Tax=Rhodocollybia butyracea TaxID=206335 RepID=A0A9P5UA61_9AGAR|nr:hypothetical protein BDP27DRAFT_1401316 [Rhodocollybia butyracea]
MVPQRLSQSSRSRAKATLEIQSLMLDSTAFRSTKICSRYDLNFYTLRRKYGELQGRRRNPGENSKVVGRTWFGDSLQGFLTRLLINCWNECMINRMVRGGNTTTRDVCYRVNGRWQNSKVKVVGVWVYRSIRKHETWNVGALNPGSWSGIIPALSTAASCGEDPR